MTDANGDGAPDLFATGFLQRPSLWINRNPRRAKSLVVTLQGDSARDRADTARPATPSGRRHRRGRRARNARRSSRRGYSFLSSGSKSLFFGLGDAASADRVTILWPSGRKTELQERLGGKAPTDRTCKTDRNSGPVWTSGNDKLTDTKPCHSRRR